MGAEFCWLYHKIHYLYLGSLNWGLSVFGLEDPLLVLNVILSEPTNQKIYNSICIFFTVNSCNKQ